MAGMSGFHISQYISTNAYIIVHLHAVKWWGGVIVVGGGRDCTYIYVYLAVSLSIYISLYLFSLSLTLSVLHYCSIVVPSILCLVISSSMWQYDMTK